MLITRIKNTNTRDEVSKKSEICTIRDYIRNETTREELQIYELSGKTRECRSNSKNIWIKTDYSSTTYTERCYCTSLLVQMPTL